MKNTVESENNATSTLQQKLKSAQKTNFILGSIIVIFLIIWGMRFFTSDETAQDAAIDFQPPAVFDPADFTEDQTASMINSESFHINMSLAYFNANLLDRAIEEGLDALRINPASAQGMNNLGYYHYAKGNFEEAKRYYRDALSINPDYDRVRTNLFHMFNVLKENAATEKEKARLQDELDNILASTTTASGVQ